MWRTILPARGLCARDCAAGWMRRRPRTLIFSCLRDKPVAEMAQILFPLFDKVIVAPIHAARAASMEDLLAAAATTGTRAIATGSVSEALALGAESARLAEWPWFRDRYTWWARRADFCSVWRGRSDECRNDELTAQSAAAALPLAYESCSAAAAHGDYRCLRIDFAAGVVCRQGWSAAASDGAVLGAGCCVGHGLLCDDPRNGEPSQPAGGCLRIEPHFVHGYAGDLCGAAVSVPNSGQEGALADRLYRVVSGQVGTDSDRHRESTCDDVEPCLSV